MLHIASRLVLLFLPLLLLAQTAIGQETGHIRFFVGPGDTYRVKIDNTVQPIGNVFEVPAGEHKVSIWAPYYFAFDTAVVVEANATLTIKKSLKPTPELLAYESREAGERTRVATKGLVPLASFVTGGVVTYLKSRSMRDSHQDYTLATYQLRLNGTEDPAILQQNYDDSRLRFNRQRNLFYVLGPVTVAAGVWTVMRFITYHKTYILPPPDKKVPWDDLGFFIPEQGGFGLTATFKIRY